MNSKHIFIGNSHPVSCILAARYLLPGLMLVNSVAFWVAANWWVLFGLWGVSSASLEVWLSSFALHYNVFKPACLNDPFSCLSGTAHSAACAGIKQPLCAAGVSSQTMLPEGWQSSGHPKALFTPMACTGSESFLHIDRAAPCPELPWAP